MHKDTPRRLRYATGYIELNLLEQANEEVEAIAFEDRLAPPVLALRLELHLALAHWETVVAISRELTHQTPKNERAWIGWAYALRELNRIKEARNVLLQAQSLHGANSAVLHYNLACYYCLLGDRDMAKVSLKVACLMDPRFEKDALADADLEAMRSEL